MFGKKNEQIKLGTLIGESTELGGNLSAKGSARVDGHVEGDVTVEGTLIVGASGRISGNVSAEAVLIGGEVLGNVSAPKKAELTASAKVLGDIATAVIVIDEHAVFQGRVDMNQEVPNKKAAAAKKPAPRPGRKSAKAIMEEALREVEAEETQENAAEETKEKAPEDTKENTRKIAKEDGKPQA